MKKVMLVFGTRPEAIKMCPLVNELKQHDTIETVVCVTGQHKEMLEQVLDVFQVTPDYDLGIMKANQTLFTITTSILEKIQPVLEQEQPDIVLVHGDTTTTFATALAAFYMGIKVGHVEAGLRTYNLQSPYPEEFNRQVTSIVADYNFAPTQVSKDNLLKEGRTNIFVTGNTVIDALHSLIDVNYDFSKDENLKKVDFNKKIILLTCHRRENWGTPMENIFDAINKVASENKDIQIIYPVHMNPQIVKLANEKLTQENIILIEPLEYVEFANLINKSHLILTDSGGLQEEAPSLGKPVLVLRTETERPEAVDAGTVKVIGVEYENVYKEITNILNDKREYDKMSNAVNPYGDGKACDRIIDFIENLR